MKLFNIKSINIFLIVIIIVSLTFDKTCSYGKYQPRSFEENIKSLERKIGPKEFTHFIDQDEAYLNFNNLTDEKILEENSLLKKLLKKLDREAINHKGIKIFEASTSLKNIMIKTAIDNRKNLLNDRRNFQYDRDSCYSLSSDKIKFDSCLLEMTESETDFNLKMLIDVIDNLERDLDFLENTSFIISPHVIDGINGYTITRSNNVSTVVIASKPDFGPKKWREMTIKSTILHEMGHVFYDYHTHKLENIKSSYIIQTDQQLSKLNKNIKTEKNEIDRWQHSKGENFAEDFRIFHSEKLGDKSFKPLKKKTVLPYNEDLFEDLILDISK